MPPVRTGTRTHRFSSPLLPERLVPPSPLPPSSDPGTSDDDLEEEERAKLNRVVCSLHDIATRDMQNYTKVLAWRHAKEDYEELYGSCSRDLKHWKPATDAAKMTAYFDLANSAPSSPATGLDGKVARHLSLLEEWDHLTAETGGDRAKASAIAAREFAFFAPNPFSAGSDARFAFDSMLRESLVAARFDLPDVGAFPPTVDNPKFLFQLNNPYSAGTSGSLNYHCYRRVVRQLMWDKKPGSPSAAAWILSRCSRHCGWFPCWASGLIVRVVVALMYNIKPFLSSHDFLPTHTTQPLMSLVIKARHSLKTLPHLPPSPFDRKIKPRRRRTTARAQASVVVPLAHRVPTPADFHPNIYMSIRDPIPPVKARKALKVFTDICYRDYLKDKLDGTPVYAADGTLDGLLIIPATIDTDRTPIYAADGTLHGTTWRRLDAADMVELFIMSRE
ncbi:hypothetical protein C8R44DRAFT_747612 [Mycena epipterygia]|nr:hypothetical protein C8R44DRAFT_747612 [Mycena epipterygia]